MLMEYKILIAMWLIGIIGFILLIPRTKRRKGILAFMMFQAIVWLCDMPSFAFGLLSAPVRLLPKATDLPLTINYFFYPLLFSIFYVHKKAKRNQWSNFTYFFVWVSAVTVFDIVIERTTDLLEYGLLTWYGMWVYIVFLFFVSEVFCNWFLKIKPH